MSKSQQKHNNQGARKPSPFKQTYYSTTQSNFFKAYAQKNDFLHRIGELLSSIQKRKITKLLEQVKISNKTFRKYLNQKRIMNIKIQDVIEFEELNQKHNRTSGTFYMNEEMKKTFLSSFNSTVVVKNGQSKSFNNNNKQSKSLHIPLQSRELIKKGFMSLLQKLQTQKKDEFVNKTKYLQSILQRQCNKLTNYGYDYKDLKLKINEGNFKANYSVVEELEREETSYGLYPIVMKNIREETRALERIIVQYERQMQE